MANNPESNPGNNTEGLFSQLKFETPEQAAYYFLAISIAISCAVLVLNAKASGESSRTI